MSNIGDFSSPKNAPDSGDLEQLLRQEFQTEIDAQQGHLPTSNSILLAIQIQKNLERHTRGETIVAWGETVLLATLAIIIMLWWSESSTYVLDSFSTLTGNPVLLNLINGITWTIVAASFPLLHRLADSI